MKKQHYELRFSGVGGQGVILAGAILAEAAVLFDGKYAIQSPNYTAQVRGGPAKVDVIISSEKIYFPQAVEINFFMSLAQCSYDQFYGGNNHGNHYFHDFAKDALLLVDSNLVTKLNNPPHKVIKLPIIELALKEMGRTIFSNIITLGIVVGALQVVSESSLISAVRKKAPMGTLDMNLRAVELGLEFANKLGIRIRYSQSLDKLNGDNTEQKIMGFIRLKKQFKF